MEGSGLFEGMGLVLDLGPRGQKVPGWVGYPSRHTHTRNVSLLPCFRGPCRRLDP